MEASTPRSVRRWFDRVLVLGFLAAIAAPAVDELIRDDDRRGPKPEMRVATIKPARPRSFGELESFPRRYESYFQDTFGLRDFLMRWHSIEKWFGLGVSPSNAIVRGLDEWIFLSATKSGPTFRGANPFSEKQLDLWIRLIESHRDYCAAMGANYLYVICPNKETIYPEYVPDHWTKIGPTRLEQLVERLKARPDLPFLDLRPSLRALKDGDSVGDELYTKLGSHWNGRGGYAAYSEIIKRISTDFPDVETIRRDHCEETSNGVGNGDSWGRRMYIDDWFSQREYLLSRAGGNGFKLVEQTLTPPLRRATRNVGSPGPRVLMFHDSFGPYVWTLLSESFREFMCSWQSHFDRELVAEFQPELVIDLHVERSLVYTSPQRAIPSPLTQWARQQADVMQFWLGPSQEPRPIVRYGETRTELLPGGVAMRLISPGPLGSLIMIPGVTLPLGGRGWLVLDIESPVEGVLELAACPPGELISGHGKVTKRVRSGRQKVVLQLAGPPGLTSIVLYPHEGAQDFKVYGIKGHDRKP